jgi:hypothetical protein
MSVRDEPPCTAGLPSEAWQRVEAVLRSFEDAWRRGRSPRVADYLPAAGPERRVLLVELAHEDLDYRLQAGQAARVEGYLADYPELAADPQAVLGLIAAEYQLRRRREPDCAVAEYLRRFPQYAAALPGRLAAPGPRPVSTLGDDAQAATPEPGAGPGAPAAVGADPGWPAVPGYEILRQLGRGGMGIVYKAFDRKRNQAVALKTMQAADAAALSRFKQEFRALANVSHPNLVSLYELIQDGAVWFFTMEFVEGVDFRTYVRAAPGLLRGALRQLAEGVAALHAAGVLHRDLKPHNVLVTPQGRVVLLDFGLAAELGRDGVHESTTEHLLGTVPYMSPEQGAAQPLSPASDWYSVGVMLYEALTGRLPFTGGAVQVLRDKEQREPLPPRALAGDVPEDLDALCAELLRRQPGQRPGAAEVLRRLGEPPAEAAPVPRARDVSLVGRQPHLQALAGALAEVRSGRPAAVYVSGRSGAGKSALVQHFLEGLSEQGETVLLSGQCYEQESVPFKAFDSLIDGLARYLGRLPDAEARAVLPRDVGALTRVFPVLRRVEAVAAGVRPSEYSDPQTVRRRAFAALRELLARLGDSRPLVLCIDDLQWGDADSAALLAELLRPPDPPVFFFIGCYRDEEPEASPFLSALVRQRDSVNGPTDYQELPVGALTLEEARALALLLLGRDDPVAETCANAVARESGGNPFFVNELVRHVQTGVDLAGGLILHGEISLDKAVWSRVQRLPEAARCLLAVVATAGRPLRQEVACQAADLGTDSRAILSSLRANHLIRIAGLAGEGQLSTYHDRVRETVVGYLTPEDLRRMHHRLALALEASGQADPELLAFHFQGADRPKAAGMYYAMAGERAAEALAFDQAARLYRAAIQLWLPQGEEGRQIRTHLGDALANAGRGAEAAKEYLAVATDSQAAEALDLRCRAALQLLISGNVDEGVEVARVVLEAVGLGLAKSPHRAALELLARRLQLWVRGIKFVSVRRFAFVTAVK